MPSRTVLLAAALSVALPTAATRARAEPGLSVGACVVADKLHPGRIIQVLSYGYVVKGFGANDSPMMWPLNDVVPGACSAEQSAGAGPDAPPAPRPIADAGAGGACFANDPAGGGGLEGRIRSVLVNGFSHQPRPGEDGRITVHVISVRSGASHRATPYDQVQFQTTPGATIYDVRAGFQTCTDYNRRVVFVQRERNFACFTKASGVFDCSMTANSPGLAQDQTREVLK